MLVLRTCGDGFGRQSILQWMDLSFGGNVAYRNRLYVAFDGDNDMWAYRMLEAWRDNDKIDFGFLDAHDLNTARDDSLTESIRRQLRERMQNSKLMLLLVGEKTKYLSRFVAWEIDYAHKIDLPIVVANLNDKCSYDPDRCPAAVLDGDVYTVHISYERNIIKYAVDYFPDEYRRNKSQGDAKRRYPASVYQSLGL
jgi:hypothetical protein